VARGPFLRLWIAQTVSLFGDFIAAFAVQVAVVFRMHGSARDATGVLLASLAPSIVLGPVAGVFADRWDPRRTMIVSDVARGVLILLVALVTTLPQLYALCFLVSCFFELLRTRAIDHDSSAGEARGSVGGQRWDAADHATGAHREPGRGRRNRSRTG